MREKIAISTMWVKGRFERMRDFVRWAWERGFEAVEMNSILDPQKALEFEEIKAEGSPLLITSLHAPCPNPEIGGKKASDLSLSALDKFERREAVKHVLSTLELASRLGAKAVVLHLGRVPADEGLERKLERLYEEGKKGEEEFEEAKRELVEARRLLSPPYLESARRSLEELLEFAEKLRMPVGLETRRYFLEIPGFEEMREILEEFPRDLVGYWHDVGHAEAQARLGFVDHRRWLEEFKDRMMGCHLHDIIGLSDHRPPGKGELNWDLIARSLPSGIIKVCEIGEWNPEEDVRGVISFLEAKGIRR